MAVMDEVRVEQEVEQYPDERGRGERAAMPSGPPAPRHLRYPPAVPTAFLLSHVLITIGGVSCAVGLCLVYCDIVAYYGALGGDTLPLVV